MELRKRITVLVPSELVYAFDPDHEHIFIATREKIRIIARPIEEYISLKPCCNHHGHYLPAYTGQCTLCQHYDEINGVCVDSLCAFLDIASHKPF